MALSRKTWVSWHQKGKSAILDFNETKDNKTWQWHQMDHAIICILLQTKQRLYLITQFLLMLFLMPNQQCQSTEANALN